MLVERVWPKVVKDAKTGKRTEFEVTTVFRKAGHGAPRMGDWVGTDCPMAYQPQVHTAATYDLWEKVKETTQREPVCDDYVAGYDARGHSDGCVTCGFAAYCHGSTETPTIQEGPS